MWVLLLSCLQLLSRAGEGQVSPPRANTRSEEPDDNTSCFRICCPKRTSSVGVTCTNKKKKKNHIIVTESLPGKTQFLDTCLQDSRLVMLEQQSSQSTGHFLYHRRDNEELSPR